MSEREWRGQWWEPGHEDDAKAGRLYEEPDGNLRLELFGVISVRLGTPFPGGVSYSGHTRSIPLLLGHSGSKAITLLAANQVLWQGDTLQRFSIARALIGCHLEEDGEALFGSVFVRVENLLPWMNQDPVSFGPSDSGTTSASVDLPEPLVAKVAGWTIRASLRHSAFDRDERTDSLVVKTRITSWLEVRSREPVGQSGFDAVVYELMDLLTLASEHASGVIEQHLSLVADRHDSVQIVGKHIHQADADAAAIDPYNFLFTCADLNFKAVVEAWLPIRQEAKTACNYIFGMKYMPNTYTELKALIYAVVAESLHGSLGVKSSRPFSNEQFETLISRVRSILVDDPAWDAWVCEKLRNQPTFAERMRDLAARPSQAAVEHIIPDRERWLRDLKNTRNGMAHGRGGGADVVDLYTVAERTRFLLALYLMAELGLSDEVQLRAARRNWYLSDQRRKHLKQGGEEPDRE